MKRACCLALSVGVLVPSPTRAQSSSPSTSTALVGGLSYGVGDTRFTPEGFEIVSSGTAATRAVVDHERTVARLAFFGVTITPRMAIVLDVDFTRAGASGFSSPLKTVGLRYRLGSRIWLGAGAGWGSLRYQPESENRTLHLRQGLALDAAAGVEIVHWPPFAFDLQARISTVDYGELRVTRMAVQFGYEVWLPLR